MEKGLYDLKRDYSLKTAKTWVKIPHPLLYIFLDQLGILLLFFVHLNNIFYKITEENMKVKPLADRVIVKLEKSETKSAGGIIIPDTAQEKTQIGVVIEVGDDKEVIKVQAGQKVMYDKYAGTQVKIGGEDHLILKMSDILAIIE